MARKKGGEHLMQFATRAIHAGQEPESATGAITVPIYQTSTFAQSAPGIHKGYDYSRTDNPTRTRAPDGARELGVGRILPRVLLRYGRGDHGDAPVQKGRSCGLLARRLRRHLPALQSGVAKLRAHIFLRRNFQRQRNRARHDSAHPACLDRVADQPASPDHRHQSGGENRPSTTALSVLVDNTFASPVFQRPLELGADLVLHSTTKYLAGHADVVGGAICLNESSLYKRLKFLQNAAGATPSPFDCFLTLRGIKTLALRMREHEKNAMQIARFLQEHARVRRVYYPGLDNHPGHDVAAAQMDGFSGIVSFEVKGGLAEARRVLARLRLFKIAESLGGVESLVELPAVMTHASIPKQERKKAGLDDGLIRLSVGIEHLQDLLEDLKRGLGR